jgi:hypothetical protein
MTIINGERLPRPLERQLVRRAQKKIDQGAHCNECALEAAADEMRIPVDHRVMNASRLLRIRPGDSVLYLDKNGDAHYERRNLDGGFSEVVMQKSFLQLQNSQWG